MKVLFKDEHYREKLYDLYGRSTLRCYWTLLHYTEQCFCYLAKTP